MKKILLLLISALFLTGCSVTNGKKIVRISHGQSETHPDHIGLLAFEKHIDEAAQLLPKLLPKAIVYGETSLFTCVLRDDLWVQLPSSAL